MICEHDSDVTSVNPLRDRVVGDPSPVPDTAATMAEFSPYLDAFDFYLRWSMHIIFRMHLAITRAITRCEMTGKCVMGILRGSGWGGRSRPTASSHAPVPRALIVPQGILQKPLTLVFLLEPRHAPPTVAHRMKSTTRLG